MDTGWFRHPNTRPETSAHRGRAGRVGAPRSTTIYRAPVRAEHPGPAPADGRDARRASRPSWTGGSPTPPSPATTSSGPARSRRTPRTWSTSPSACAGVEVGMLFIEQARGGVQVSDPVAERARLLPGSPASSAAAATARRPGRRLPEPLAESVARRARRGPQALDPAAGSAQRYEEDHCDVSSRDRALPRDPPCLLSGQLPAAAPSDPSSHATTGEPLRFAIGPGRPWPGAPRHAMARAGSSSPSELAPEGVH